MYLTNASCCARARAHAFLLSLFRYYWTQTRTVPLASRHTRAGQDGKKLREDGSIGERNDRGETERALRGRWRNREEEEGGGGESSEMVSGCGRTERCYIQIRVDDGMRT